MSKRATAARTKKRGGGTEYQKTIRAQSRKGKYANKKDNAPPPPPPIHVSKPHLLLEEGGDVVGGDGLADRCEHVPERLGLRGEREKEKRGRRGKGIVCGEGEGERCVRNNERVGRVCARATAP